LLFKAGKRSATKTSMEAQATVFKKIDIYVINVYRSTCGVNITVYIKREYSNNKTWSRFKIVTVKVIEP